MLVDALKIGGRDHARAVIPVSAMSVVAGARNHEYYTMQDISGLTLFRSHLWFLDSLPRRTQAKA